MNFIAQVLFGMFVMGVLDLPVIKYIISPTLSRHAPELVARKPDVIAAFLFYVGYVSLVVLLSQRGANTVRDVALNGAFLGLFAYGTYELTNKAVIEGWPWVMVVTDVIWGTVLTASIAASVFYVFNR